MYNKLFSSKTKEKKRMHFFFLSISMKFNLSMYAEQRNIQQISTSDFKFCLTLSNKLLDFTVSYMLSDSGQSLII